jgi:hypothetical protein
MYIDVLTDKSLFWDQLNLLQKSFQQIWENENFFWIRRVGAMFS